MADQVDSLGREIPYLILQKAPQPTLHHLRNKYPDGGEFGWYAFVEEIGSFAYWDVESKSWKGDKALVFKEEAETARDAALQAQEDAEKAKDDAVIAKGLSETARDQSVAARNEAVNLVSQVGIGTPKGTFTALVDLQTVDPDHQYIYLVISDGHWYYWNETEEEWADGGAYQAPLGNAVKYAANYGFLPDSTGIENTLALQAALDDGGGGKVVVSRVGVYELDNTVFLGSNTHLEFVPGCTIKKVHTVGHYFSQIFSNKGCLDDTWNKKY